jgi:hypothetical protein
MIVINAQFIRNLVLNIMEWAVNQSYQYNFDKSLIMLIMLILILKVCQSRPQLSTHSNNLM